MWPKYVDMSDNECKQMLRKLELEAYSNVVSALRAQGPLTDEKHGLLVDIASELHIPRERYSAEIRRAVNDEKLATVALQIYGPNTEIKWAIEGRRETPLIPRLHSQTAYSVLADKIANIASTENAKLPLPTKANRKEENVLNYQQNSNKKFSNIENDSRHKLQESKEEVTFSKPVSTKDHTDSTAEFSQFKSVDSLKENEISKKEKVSVSEPVDDEILASNMDGVSSKRRKVFQKTNFIKPPVAEVTKTAKNDRPANNTTKTISTTVISKPSQNTTTLKTPSHSTSVKSANTPKPIISSISSVVPACTSSSSKTISAISSSKSVVSTVSRPLSSTLSKTICTTVIAKPASSSTPIKSTVTVSSAATAKPSPHVASTLILNSKSSSSKSVVVGNILSSQSVTSTYSNPNSSQNIVVSSNNSGSTYKVVNKSANQPVSSNSTLLHTPAATGIKVIAPRSSVTSTTSRPTFETDLTRPVHPNFSSIRLGAPNNLIGMKHNVVVMQKNSQVKHGVTLSSSDLVNKVLKRKLNTGSNSPSVSKIPKVQTELSSNSPIPSQGNILVLDANLGKSSNQLSSLNLDSVAATTSAHNLGSHVKTYAKSKFILPVDPSKSQPLATNFLVASKIPVSCESKLIIPKRVTHTVSSSSTSVSDAKAGGVNNEDINASNLARSLSADTKLDGASFVNMILTVPVTTNSSSNPSVDSLSVMPSTKIIFAHVDGKVLGSLPSTSIAGPQNPINFLFAGPTAPSTTVISSTVTKSSIAPSLPQSSGTINETNSISTISSNFSHSQNSNVSKIVSVVPLKTSMKCNFNETHFKDEPIIVNVPSIPDIERNSLCPSSSSRVNDLLVNLNDTEVEDVGVLDPVTGIYSFPFDEGDSTHDSTTASANSSTEYFESVETKAFSPKVLSVSTDLEVPACEDISSEIIIEQVDIAQAHLLKNPNDSFTSNESSNDCDISNISVTEITVEEGLESLDTSFEESIGEEFHISNN